MSRLIYGVVLFLAALLMAFGIAGIGTLFAQEREEWSLRDMNALIDETNFIVGRGCSGTLISVEKRLILTNHHCVDSYIRVVTRERSGQDGRVNEYREERRDPVPVEQHSYDGYETVGTTSYVTEIVAHRKTRDLAVLRVRAASIPHVAASRILPKDAEVVRGERVFVVGNPAGLEATVVEGIVSNVNRTFRFPWAEREDLPMIQYSGGTFGGNSGGALYNARGELIGVPAASHRQANFIGLAVPAELVREFLADECLASAFDPEADDEACRAEADAEE